ncbi:site-2 protease family protein [Patescibacteria group bacterium]|nr:site-2 protease family protein [Patescibacteria group bacterium]MBU1016353.1 site-2 protease family protein [Patescibacteria group bacterium]MBU1684647.1 site-2 protease family protein [Patescibacteria group bacterium]MBU1938423.1 site-2 protease family protein [Patescibacteria group bacterium]
MILITILAFIVIFSILVLVHEWGHFYFARRAGIKVEEFGIGLPPRAKAFYKDKKGTVYSLNWIPFGGYVRLYGEDSSDPRVLKAKNSFASKSLLSRSGVIVAGVFMNFVLAWVLLSVVLTIGMRPILVTQSDINNASAAGLIEVQDVLAVNEILPGSPLAGTDLQEGDLVVWINGQGVPAASDLSRMLQPGQPVVLSILRGEREGVLTAIPDENGKLGFAVSNMPYVVFLKDLQYPFYKAPFEAVREVGRLSYLTLNLLGDVVVSLVQKLTVPEEVTGPVGIAKMTYKFMQEGAVALIQFVALLSISLGVINIMPFPALDGGRFLFIIFEAVTRRRPNAKWETMIHGVGFVLLILLIFVVTWNDIVKMF